MEKKELRQLQNAVEIVGTLKSKTLEVKTSQKGNQYMKGELVILTEDGPRINEHKVAIMVMMTSKLYKGIETVNREYKSIEEYGKEDADRIRVNGELTLQQYYNQQGVLVSFNQIKGVFFNRVEDDAADKALASIETVVEGFVDKLDADGFITGTKQVKGFSIGWGNSVIELKNAVVNEALAEAMTNMYTPGSTGRLTYKLNNYVEVSENEAVVENVEHGFGSTEDKVEMNTVNKYTNNLEIVSGDIPFLGTKEYTEEEIALAKQVQELALQTLQQPAATIPDSTQATGFGSTPPETPPATQTQTGSASPFTDGMPDF